MPVTACNPEVCCTPPKEARNSKQATQGRCAVYFYGTCDGKEAHLFWCEDEEGHAGGHSADDYLEVLPRIPVPIQKPEPVDLAGVPTGKEKPKKPKVLVVGSAWRRLREYDDDTEEIFTVTEILPKGTVKGVRVVYREDRKPQITTNLDVMYFASEEEPGEWKFPCFEPLPSFSTNQKV